MIDLGYLGVKGIFIRSVLYCRLLEEPTLNTNGKHSDLRNKEANYLDPFSTKNLLGYYKRQHTITNLNMFYPLKTLTWSF